MTIRTTLLECRLPAGRPGAARHGCWSVSTRRSCVRSAPEFVAAKLAERDERIQRAGASRYLVEPNVKEGKGGLRDLNTLFWIAKYAYRVQDAEALVGVGLFTEQELRLFRRCEAFLWKVRCFLHFLTGRAEERLSFDMQRQVAEKLGYASRDGLSAVERFMKHYFTIAKDVGDLTNIVCAALEERQAKPQRRCSTVSSANCGGAPSRAISALSPWRPAASPSPRPTLFDKDPVNLIRLFQVAARNELPIHPDALRLVTQSLPRINAKLRADPEANRLFLEILTSPKSCERALRLMNEAGVLGRFIPEFGRIVAMMQFNMYHHYTVDEHLLRPLGQLGALDLGEQTDELPLASSIMPTISHRRALYVAVLLHDIAKGRKEDHSIAGAEIARKLGPRLGLSEAETEAAAWLVEYHLIMSNTAQGRDLVDRGTIEDFAKAVQTIERLKMLLVLTVCDIRAVGPGVWNGWKAELLRTLYWETEVVLAGGHSSIDRKRRVEKSASRTAREASGLVGPRIRRICGPPLSRLLAQGRSAAPHRPRPIAARHSGRNACAGDGSLDRRLSRRHRTHRRRARPSAPAVDHRRRLRRLRRQYRGRADLHHHRRPGAGHDQRVARLRPRRGRDAARAAHRPGRSNRPCAAKSASATWSPAKRGQAAPATPTPFRSRPTWSSTTASPIYTAWSKSPALTVWVCSSI